MHGRHILGYFRPEILGRSRPLLGKNRMLKSLKNSSPNVIQAKCSTENFRKKTRNFGQTRCGPVLQKKLDAFHKYAGGRG